MPRTGRLHLDHGYYHVMGRGLERRWIFRVKEDKEDFLERLGAGLDQTASRCLAWSLMSNHYHLLIQVGNQPLSRLMSKLLSGYATQYNRRHRRVGYVFQNRYKSILIDADQYLLELIRYIHLNPIRAKVIRTLSELDRYRWTGHAGILGNQVREWQNTKDVLALFATRTTAARQHYRQFIDLGIHTQSGLDLSGGGLIRSYGGWETSQSMRKEHEMRIGDERILGESDFVENALKQDELQLKKKDRLKQKGWNLSKLTKKVCEYFSISEKDLVKKGRSNDLSIGKDVLCYFAIYDLSISSTELMKRLNVSQPAISKSTRRGEIYCQQHKIEIDHLST